MLSLNPYSNGIYSMRLRRKKVGTVTHSLNPYSNGIYSMRSSTAASGRIREHGLNPYSNGIYSMSGSNRADVLESISVLILILMEYTL